MWAEETYRMGYPCIAASPWLARAAARPLRRAAPRRSSSASTSTSTGPLDVPARPTDGRLLRAPGDAAARDRDGAAGARRAGRAAGPDTRVVLFGDTQAPRARRSTTSSRACWTPPALARLYNEATVGLVISLTNYSLMPKEMMACGLPVVDVRHPSVVSVFGAGRAGDRAGRHGLVVDRRPRSSRCSTTPARRERLGARGAAVRAGHDLGGRGRPDRAAPRGAGSPSAGPSALDGGSEPLGERALGAPVEHDARARAAAP